MCGIIGACGSIWKKEKEAIRDLFFFDTIRGRHSTGIVVADTEGDWETAKQIGTPGFLFEDEMFDQNDLTLKRPANLIIGHNRWATIGNKNDIENAHPFVVDDTLVGVHNGTIRNDIMFDHYGQFDTDSECLYNDIHKNGIEKTIKKTNGAYALVWYDDEDCTVNFLRNTERTLYHCWNKDFNTLFWASDREMLMFALMRNNIDHHTIEAFTPHMLYKLEVKKGYEMSKASLVNMGKVEPFQRHVPKNTVITPPKKAGTTPAKKERPPLYVVGGGGCSVEMKEQQGKTHTFYFNEWAKGKNCIYLKGISNEMPNLEIRAYAENSIHRKDIDDFNQLFEGKVRKVRKENGKTYASIDLRTIMPIEPEKSVYDRLMDEMDEQTIKTNHGHLKLRDYVEATKNGCAHCSKTIELEDAETVIFTGRDEVLCEDCAELPQFQGLVSLHN